MSETQRLRVSILTNIPAPYRLPVFEKLGEIMELTVFFCEAGDPERLWQVDLCSDVVRYVTLQSRRVNVLNQVEIVCNPGLGKWLQTETFDVYIAGENFVNFPAVVAVMRAAHRYKKPFVLWSESISTPYASGTFLSDLYRRWLYRRTAAFLAYSEGARAFLERRGAPPQRIVQGYQIVPPEQLPPATVRGGTANASGVTVLFVGYLQPRKGVLDLVKAFQTVARPEDRLVLVGSGPQEAELRALARTDPRIALPGYADAAERSNWYAQAQVFVLPTHHDPWGLVVNEAMHFGLPIITTDAAGAAELVQGNGFVVPAGDVTALAKKLDRLLADPVLLAEMGRRSREIIAGYTVERSAQAFLDVIEPVCERKAG